MFESFSICDFFLLSGSGKTFTLLTLAYSLPHRPIYTIIFKNDLLVPFEYISTVFSVAQFFMSCLGMKYLEYINFVEQLSAKINQFDYIKLISSLITKMKFNDLRNVLVIIDEYTVINKSLLFALLIIFKHYNVGCVISGDKNQLQTIGDSKNTKTLTSFDLVKLFADRVFTFTKNERCGEPEYNDVIKLVSNYASNKRLDNFGYCLVAATLFDNIYGIPDFTDTFLASTHRSLAITQHTMTGNPQNDIKTSFYIMDKTIKHGTSIIRIADDNGMILPLMEYPKPVREYINWAKKMENKEILNSIVNKTTLYPFKFLPYLPLKVNCKYYVKAFSENCIGELIDIDMNNKILTLRMIDNGSIIRVTPSSKFEGVIFEEHLRWLHNETKLNDYNPDNVELGCRGKILNYPIYPARFMTIHRCQGCTITDRINIDLCDANYQALYVAMSRVKNRNQIVSIKIPQQIAHTLTVIVNFKEYCEQTVKITADLIKSRLNSNYQFYIPKPTWYDYYVQTVLNFIQNKEQRASIRDEILKHLSIRTTSEIIVSPIRNDATNDDVVNNEDNESVILYMLRYDDLFKRLTLWQKWDRFYWLHEFMRIDDDLKSERIHLSLNAQKYTSLESLRMIFRCTQLRSIPLTESSLQYIRDNCQMSSEKNELTIEEIKGTFDNNSYLQTPTLFQKLLYLKLKNDEEITKEWLIQLLHSQDFTDCDSTASANDTQSKKSSLTKRLSMSDVAVFKRKRLRN